MTENENSAEPNVEPNAVEPPKTEAQPPQTSGGTHTDGASLDSLRATLEALPERIAKSVAESLPKPAKPARPAPTDADKAVVDQKVETIKEAAKAAGNEASPGIKKSFADKWFGR